MPLNLDSGRIRRGVARSGGVVVALIGHLAVLSAIGYQSASETILGELPAAITVAIVFEPPPRAVVPPQEPATADDDNREHDAAFDRSQAVAVEQQPEPAAPQPPAVTADPAFKTITTAKQSPPTPKRPERQVSPKKREGAPLAVASASNPNAAPGSLNGESTGAVGVSATESNVPSSRKNKLLSYLDRYKHYPDAARAQRREGTALLSFGMDRDGRVLAYYLVRSSGCPELDDEVLAMIARLTTAASAPRTERAGRAARGPGPIQDVNHVRELGSRTPFLPDNRT